MPALKVDLALNEAVMLDERALRLPPDVHEDTSLPSLRLCTSFLILRSIGFGTKRLQYMSALGLFLSTPVNRGICYDIEFDCFHDWAAVREQALAYSSKQALPWAGYLQRSSNLYWHEAHLTVI